MASRRDLFETIPHSDLDSICDYTGYFLLTTLNLTRASKAHDVSAPVSTNTVAVCPADPQLLEAAIWDDAR